MFQPITNPNNIWIVRSYLKPVGFRAMHIAIYFFNNLKFFIDIYTIVSKHNSSESNGSNAEKSIDLKNDQKSNAQNSSACGCN